MSTKTWTGAGRASLSIAAALLLLFEGSAVAAVGGEEGAERDVWRIAIHQDCIIPHSVLRGTLQASDGRALQNSTVSVSALPKVWGEVTQAVRLGVATTGLGGDFEIRICSALPTGVKHDDGGVQLLISGGTDDDLVYSEVLAYPGTRETGRYWTFDAIATASARQANPKLATDFIVTEDDAATTLVVRAHASDAGGSALVGSSDPTTQGSSVGASHALAAATASSSTPICRPPRDIESYIDEGRRTRVYVPIQRFKTLSKLNKRFDWTTTRETRLEVGVVGPRKFGVGLVRSTNNRDSTGVIVRAAKNKAFRTDVEWQYAGYRIACSSSHTPRPADYTDYISWRPLQMTGGSRNVNAAVSWTCNTSRRVNVANETWVLRNGTVAWSGHFSIGGLGLSSSQRTTSTTKLSLIPVASGARACGDNDFPLNANRVQEVP